MAPAFFLTIIKRARLKCSLKYIGSVEFHILLHRQGF